MGPIGQRTVLAMLAKGADGREQFSAHVTSRLSAQQFPLSPVSY